MYGNNKANCGICCACCGCMCEDTRKHEPDYDAIAQQFGEDAAYAVMAAVDNAYAQNKVPSSWSIVCLIDRILQEYL